MANIMVISVLERRSEIGLRRSLGTTKGHIRVRFLAEAILLSLASGIAGIAQARPPPPSTPMPKAGPPSSPHWPRQAGSPPPCSSAPSQGFIPPSGLPGCHPPKHSGSL